MTTEERKALRKALIGQGFERIDYTADLRGRGVYTETWANGQNTVSISWSARTGAAMVDVETAGGEERVNEVSKASVAAAEAAVFKDRVCRICGHMQGDHERFEGTVVWTCDADECDEDLLGYCKPSRVG